MKFKLLIAGFWLLCAAGLVSATETLKPYVLASVVPADVNAKLAAEGFEVVGEYEPYPGAKVIVITSEALKLEAAKSEFGGYGATVRVAITDDEVSYTNPAYWANGYRMATDLVAVTTILEEALGNAGTFGSKKGITKEKLAKYQYKPLMPRFDKPVELATFPTHKKAVEVVEAGLQAGKGKTKLVYRVDIPDKDETVFGMGLLGDHDGADRIAMTTLNKGAKGSKHTAYMPYEILVSGTKAYMLHGKFRIALSFPDLSMFKFMKIRGAPKGIENAAKAVTVE
ncbi:MAG: hypothetical protein DRQ49_06510 [Gammaproteobacteria bacterium]|nr:MAG: hypothetical protein DRQ49_06510 [Gammaproteobacteria bacterium]RKZ45015.1 MAG: hypothetical protein DRQ41_01335 [Gammaproteobacteria bacterium]